MSGKSRPVPRMNLDEPGDLTEHRSGPFHQKYTPIGEKIGARRLGYNLTVLPPGQKACPFHNHRINEEMFLILDGEGLLRFGDREFSLRRHDIVACPPGGREVAHQILNTGEGELRYLALSTRDPFEIAEFPDSNKIMSMVGDYGRVELRHVAKADDGVELLEGES